MRQSNRNNILQIFRSKGRISISFFVRQSKYVIIDANIRAQTIKRNPMFLEKITVKTCETEKNNKNVVTSAAIPIERLRLCKMYAEIINVRINNSTGNNIKKETTLMMSITYFILFI